MKTTLALSLVAAIMLSACSSGSDGVHPLTPDEVRRAQVNAEAYFNAEFPAGVDASGNIVKRKGSWTSCRPQDSNSNNLVTCTGVVPNVAGQYVTTTMYCGYNAGKDAVIGCNDKDQKL